ncbi:Fumarate reductase subunit C [Caenispirillum salinarum AK4]|uniref:Fumarate reductase subunit C n=1 Tax=Caenispirillum salinarum AK4 TaxID=1238182 RepID=K9HKG5_9PROT|nr:fumarate reductase subunit C [Caenispirillum salinarum]EKV30863.1 Fumarate reductase subunit C [Caenispirillum salinarum AK4]
MASPDTSHTSAPAADRPTTAAGGQRKPFRRPWKNDWWLHKRAFTLYMIRELTCVALAAYSAVLIYGLGQLAEGRAAWEGFVDALSSPAFLTFHVLALALMLYHTITWFSLTPKAMPIMRGDNFVPGRYIIGAHYAVWAVVSLIVLIIAGSV